MALEYIDDNGTIVSECQAVEKALHLLLELEQGKINDKSEIQNIIFDFIEITTELIEKLKKDKKSCGFLYMKFVLQAVLYQKEIINDYNLILKEYINRIPYQITTLQTVKKLLEKSIDKENYTDISVMFLIICTLDSIRNNGLTFLCEQTKRTTVLLNTSFSGITYIPAPAKIKDDFGVSKEIVDKMLLKVKTNNI